MGRLYESFLCYLSTDKQKHLNFIFHRLGFTNNDIKVRFVEAFYKNRSHDKVYKILQGELSFRKSHATLDTSGVPELYNPPILSFLKKHKEEDSNYITATDISSFVFCPASYSIKKTFNELQNRSKTTVVGSNFHEQNRLAVYISDEREKYKFTNSINKPEFYTSENKEFFNDIRSSSIVYIGHTDNNIRYFKSLKGNFIGQPDYIFKNKNASNFIVEEKFINFSDKTNYFHLNHKAQLSSYLLGLDTINADYGYLVYWYYDYREDTRYIKECIVYKIEKADIDKVYMQEIYKNILALNNGIALPFNIDKLHARKCASCLYRLFCGHKTGRFPEIIMPYNKVYYALLK